MEYLGFDLIVLHSKRQLKFVRRLSLKNLARHSPFSPASLASQKCINYISVLYKARENCIYTCKNIYLRVIHLIIQFINILLQILQRKSPTNYTIANYTIAVKYNFLQLYNRSVYIVFLFLYKAREKHISSCYTLNIADEIGSELYNCALYNCSEIGQRIIQLQRNRPANYTIQASELYTCICIANYTVFMFAMERNYAKFVIAYKYEFFVCYM